MLIRQFDPFADMSRAANAMRSNAVPMDAVRREDEIEVYFDLPGVDPDSVELTADGGQLTLEAERSFEVAEGDKLIAAERRHGRLRRTLQLGDSLDATGVVADYSNGVLTVRIPFAEAAKPRKVEIGVGTDN